MKVKLIFSQHTILLSSSDYACIKYSNFTVPQKCVRVVMDGFLTVTSPMSEWFELKLAYIRWLDEFFIPVRRLDARCLLTLLNYHKIDRSNQFPFHNVARINP
jgi:hypothetical protein